MTIVINDTLGAYGGTHTLTLRICTWLKENGYKTVVFCDSDGNTEIVSALREKGIAIVCFDSSDIDRAFEEIYTLMKSDEVRVISYMWDKYLDMEIVKYYRNIEFDNILYCVHYGTFYKGTNYPGIVRWIIKRKLCHLFLRMNKYRSIVMMDEDTTDKTADYFAIAFKPATAYARIPMICEPDERAEEIIRKGFNSETMMTAARAEFPYKGYLLGLICEYEKLKSVYKKLKVIIVSGGETEDVKKITDRIEELPEEVKKDVEFHNWMNYDNLKKKMEECKFFIGMGTGVLDAGLKYKPAIPVKYNTYDVIASNLISEAPQFITSVPNDENPAYNFIERIMKMDFLQYRTEAFRTFDAIKECYNIDNNIKVLLENNPKQKKTVLKFGDIVLIKILRTIGKIKYRNMTSFDVRKVEKE